MTRPQEIVDDLLLSMAANGGALPFWYEAAIADLSQDELAELVALLRQSDRAAA